MTNKVAAKGRGGRPSKGSIAWKSGQWWARITLLDGSRPLVPLDPAIPHENEDRARACAADVSATARATGAVPVTTVETFAEWCKRWTDERAARGLTSVYSDRSRIRRHILPALGPKDVGQITREHLEALVADLDGKVTRGEMAWRQAKNVWGLVTKMFDDAQNAKHRNGHPLRTW